MIKTRVVVVFGGVSNEHKISCISAASIIDNIQDEAFEVVQLGITKKGQWLVFSGGTQQIRNGSWSTSSSCTHAVLSPDRTTHGLLLKTDENTFKELRIDVIFPVLHGKNGEDGTIQGLFEISGIPYVGCDVLSSAMCLDKVTTNQLLDLHHIPQTPWMYASPNDADSFENLHFRLGEKLSFPIFVKPSVGGSSIGVTKARNAEEMQTATNLALTHCDKVLYEQAVSGLEIECAVLGNANPIVSMPGEVVSCNEVYDYEAKYHSGDASKTYIPAHLPAEKLEEIRRITLQAYIALNCSGLARVDFFVEQPSGRVLLNEINTMPGFTPISMYPKMMESYGIPLPALVSRLITLALEKAEGAAQ